MTGQDPNWFLSSTEEDWVSLNETLSEVVMSMAAEYSIPLGDIVATETPLGQIVGRADPLWEVLAEAVQRHHNLTQDTYRIFSPRRVAAHEAARVGHRVLAFRSRLGVDFGPAGAHHPDGG